MKAAINPPSPVKKRSWLRILFWGIGLFIVLPVLLFCLWYVWLWGNFDFGEEKLKTTLSCGDYRLLYYTTENGNGRVDYAHKSGKVYGQFPLKNLTETEPMWDADCKGVRIGTGDYATHLKASE